MGSNPRYPRDSAIADVTARVTGMPLDFLPLQEEHYRTPPLLFRGRMRFLIFAAAALLSGCAASIAGLGEKQAQLTLESSRPAQQVAGCLATELQGTNPMLTLAEGHFVIARNNTYGMPIVRWDIFATDTGSRLELRAQGPFGEGIDKAKDCAGL